MIRKLIEARASEECGCPEELWLVGTLEVLIHLEEDGSGHIFVDTGDWELDIRVTTTGIEDLREQAFAAMEQIPAEEGAQ